MTSVEVPSEVVTCQNWVGGQWVSGSGALLDVFSPINGQKIGGLSETTVSDVQQAVRIATEAGVMWAKTPIKERSQIMFRVRDALHAQLDALSHIVASESGKTFGEAKAGILKGVEVLEYALSLQNLDMGGRLEVSSGVHCEYRREPLGVVVGITPFNFPAMVPMWMLPIALTLGNAFIWKPSEKTPLTSKSMAAVFEAAGLPPGVLTVLQGGRTTVEALLDAEGIAAAGFVGSTAVARQVFARGTSAGKRVLALGGAKNHIILMPDADEDMAVNGILASFTGCAGQRCMAASVLIAVGDSDRIVEKVAEHARRMTLGADMGAIITRESVSRLEHAVTGAVEDGATLLVDGRNPAGPAGCEDGYWFAPTIVDGVASDSRAAKEELFGPVLTVVRCETLSEALAIEQSSTYGNAAAVFTQSGAVAERVAREASAGMVGVNVGVPVPREPFSFGGINASKFGHGDITGQGSLDFWTNQKKVTTKWALQTDQTWMS